jgi:alkylation response protein AidB-like acyl-CoA dehydrogenase
VSAATTPRAVSEDGLAHSALIARVDAFVDANPPDALSAQEFAGRQFDAGLAWPHFPVGLGGIDAPRWAEGAVRNRLTDLGAPDLRLRNVLGYGMAAPTIVAIGTDAQRRRHLRRIFTCEDVWCQMFSEPGAGSDVAGLSTRAIRDGDVWVINGQKVWTSYAHVARYGLLLARTDPEATKHSGITYFVLDLHQPGVEVRPLRQLTGDAEFNEVFLTNAIVPSDSVLGDVGDGWRGSLLTLMNERAALGSRVEPRGSGPISLALDIWRREPGRRGAERDEMIRLWSRAEVLRLLNARRAARAVRSGAGPEDSISKLAFAELSQAIYEFCLRLLGPAGMLYGSYEMRRLEENLVDVDNPGWIFLRTRANSIAGGTSEVQRNILGERVLGLPGEVRVDKGVPWSQVPR